MQELHGKYADQGFEIVGIHAPDFSSEAEVPNIEEAATDLGVTWPIVLDTRKRTFRSWQEGPTGHWPRIDRTVGSLPRPPSTAADPPVGRMKSSSIRAVVDFPDPLRPRNA
jgi:hypothetical protein